jgi:hypothetical protein
MLDTDIFIRETGLIDKAINGHSGLVQSVGKPFVLSKLCSTTRGTNYGWTLPKGTKSPWNGVPIYPSVTLNSMVIQQPGNAHGLNQDDYASSLTRGCVAVGTSAGRHSVLVLGRRGVGFA